MKHSAAPPRLPETPVHSFRPPLRSVVVFVVTLLWFGVFATIGVDPHHDGIMLKCAADIAAGKRLFAETFCQYGDLTVLLQALALKVTGVRLLTIRLLTVLFYAGSAVLVDRLWGRFLRTAAGGIFHLVLFWGMVPFTMVTFHPWSSVYALFFMLLSAELLLRFLECGTEGRFAAGRRFAFLSGVAAGCAFGCRTPVGVVSAVAVAAFFAFAAFSAEPEERRRTWNAWLLWCAGASAWPIVGALRITFTGAWKDYLHQCFRFVGAFALKRGGVAAAATGANGGIGALWEKLSQSLFPFTNSLWPIDIFYGVIPLTVLAALGLTLLERRRRDGDRTSLRLIALLFFALVSWHQFYPVPCVRHLYWASIPMFGAFVWLLERMWAAGADDRRGIRFAARTAVAVLLLFPAAAVAWRLYFGVLSLHGLPSRQSAADVPLLRGMKLNTEEAELFRVVSRTVGNLPSELTGGFLNATADGLFSLMLPEPVPPFRHPMFVNWNRDVYPDYPEKLAEFIAEHRPAVMTQSDIPPFPGSVLCAAAKLRGTVYFFWITPRKR